jgi:hypothetical protein
MCWRTRCSQRHALASAKELQAANGGVHLLLKSGKEAFLTELHSMQHTLRRCKARAGTHCTRLLLILRALHQSLG